MNLEINPKKTLVFNFDGKTNKFVTEKLVLKNPTENTILFKVLLHYNFLSKDESLN